MKGWTQSELADRAASSRAAISRYELGTTEPDRSAVDLLDDALDAAGELTAFWAALLGAPAARRAKASARWVHNYPAAYTGLIWMRWTAAVDNTDPTIDVEVRWGPWVLRHRLAWPAERTVAVWHTKGDDGLSIPVIVRTSAPILVEFHIGEGPADARDINPGWINDGR